MNIKLLLIFLLGLLLSGCAAKMDNGNNFKNMNEAYKEIREPAVAGKFYPGDKAVLARDIKRYLDDVKSGGELEFSSRAIMVPHAGYAYSGSVAAYSYKRLMGREIGTVVLISNSHTSYFGGIAVDKNDVWETPLGSVEVDRSLADKLVRADAVINYNSAAHKQDHVLEAQLPFLQTVLAGEFKIVPLLFGNSGNTDYKKLARVLADNLSNDDLIVVSSDMSHYPVYEDANRIDRGTLEFIKKGDISELEKYIGAVESEGIANEQTLACGIDAIKTVMELGRLLGWDRTEVLHYANSGDVPIGDKTQVVGYGAVIFGRAARGARLASRDINSTINILDNEQKSKLLKIARETVEEFARNGKLKNFAVKDERLKWKEGAFVTLRKDGNLRGCIGQIVPSEKPLWEVVRDMAIAACSEDPRFNPVREEELDNLEYEVSVLSAPKRINDWKKIELGKHGVIVRKDFYSGVFLPQVADETGWDLEKFLQELCAQKAGLAPDCYKNDPDVKIEVFTAQVFK